MSDSIPPPGYSSESMLHGSGSAHIVAMRGGGTGSAAAPSASSGTVTAAVSSNTAAVSSNTAAANATSSGNIPVISSSNTAAVSSNTAAANAISSGNIPVISSSNTAAAPSASSGTVTAAVSGNTAAVSSNTAAVSGNTAVSSNTAAVSSNVVDASGNTIKEEENKYEIEWEGSTYTLAKTLDEWEDEEDESLFLNFIGIPKRVFSSPGEYYEFINNLSGCVNDGSSIDAGCDAVNAIFKKVILMHIEDLSDQQRYGNVQKVMKIIDPESDEQLAEGAITEGETPEGKSAEGSTSQNNAAAKNTEQPPSGGKNQPVAVEKLS